MFSGQGASLTYMPSYDINKDNWPAKYYGVIIGALQIPYQVGPVIISIIYNTAFAKHHYLAKQNIEGFYLLLWITLACLAVFALIFTNKFPFVTVENESSSLITEPSSDSNKNTPDVVHSTLMEGVGNLDTQLMFWAQVLTVPSGFAMLNNITVILHALNHQSLNFSYTVLAPLVGMIMKMVSAFLSDTLAHKLSRVHISLILSIPAAFFMFLSIFIGDNITIISLNYFLIVGAAESTFTLLPAAISERFHQSLFGYVFSAACSVPTILVAIAQLFFGLVYDSHSLAFTNQCYGLQCFRFTFLILLALQVSGILCHVLFCWRQARTENRGNLNQSELVMLEKRKPNDG